MSGTDGHVDRILAERARLLARPLAEPGVRGEEVVVLEGGGERDAVALTWVERVHPVEAVTPLPGLRAPWRGLISLRGELLPALDVPSYLGQGSPGPPGRPVGCAVVAHGGLPVAFLSDAPITLLLRGDGDLVTVLDVPTILADAALVVDD